MKNLAQCYDLLFGKNLQDLFFYQNFIEQNQPALEIGSGTGRLLLEYLKLGFQVDGIEPDNEMFELFSQKCSTLNLKSNIYIQSLQQMNLSKKYKTIYMPLYVFQNIADRHEAINGLRLAYEHLESSGQVLISIFIPWNDPTGTWENTWRLRASYYDQKQGEAINLSESLSFDKFEQIQTKQFRYEIFKNTLLEQVYLATLQLRCYSRFEMLMMLENIGFKNVEIFGDYFLQEASANTSCFIFKANK